MTLPHHQTNPVLSEQASALLEASDMIISALWFLLFLFLFFLKEFLCSFGTCPGASSCRPGWPRTHRDPHASASRVLGLKVCATIARRYLVFYKPLLSPSFLHDFSRISRILSLNSETQVLSLWPWAP